MPDAFELSDYVAIQKALFSSLRLKEVTDNAVAELTKLTDRANIALFLTDNQSQSFKLLPFAGYSPSSLAELQLVQFSQASLLSVVKANLAPASITGSNPDLPISANIMQREASQTQLGLPLIASNILVGAVLFDFKRRVPPTTIDVLGSIAETIAIAIANSILFGLSEYERERYSTFYKCVSQLNSGSLTAQAVFQAVIDTASFLGNTPHCALLLYDAEKDSFNLAAFTGIAEDSLSQFNLSGTGTIAGSTLKLGKTEYLIDSSHDNAGLPSGSRGTPFNSVIALPLIDQGIQLGVLHLFSTDFYAFKDDQVELLESLRKEASKALHAVLKSKADAASSVYNSDNGLYTRPYFEQLFREAIEEADKQHTEVGLLILSIDYPAWINERSTDNQEQGVVNEIVMMFKDALRDQDKVCRLAEDEFAILFPEALHESVLQIAERLCLKIRQSKLGNASIGEVTISVGVANFPLHGSDPSGILQGCEQALLVAKYQGGDQVVQPYSGRLFEQAGLPATVAQSAWEGLVESAKLAKKRSKPESRLTPAPEFAMWLTQDPVLVEGERSE